MNTQDITYLALILAYLLLLVPFIFSFIFKLKIIKKTIISVLRMTAQLFAMAFILEFLFLQNISFINVLWLSFMIGFASYTIVKESDLKIKHFIIQVFVSILITTFIIVLYFNSIIIQTENIFTARYLIVIGGMLLGNSLSGNIVGVNIFFKDIKRNENRYMYHLTSGATLFEAIIPYFRNSLVTATKPTIASMATIGIVFLPGMMTGQILGGASPLTAIKYQIAIMLAIFASVSLSVFFSLLLTAKKCFNEYGVIRKDIYKSKNS